MMGKQGHPQGKLFYTNVKACMVVKSLSLTVFLYATFGGVTSCSIYI